MSRLLPLLVVALLTAGCAASSGSSTAATTGSPSPAVDPTATAAQGSAELARQELTPTLLPGFARDGAADTSLDTTTFDFCDKRGWFYDSARLAQEDHDLADEAHGRDLDETLTAYEPGRAHLALVEFGTRIFRCASPYTTTDSDNKPLKVTVDARSAAVPDVPADQQRSVVESASFNGQRFWSVSVLRQQGDLLVIEAATATSRSAAVALVRQAVRSSLRATADPSQATA